MMLQRCSRCDWRLPLQAFAWRKISHNKRDTCCWLCRAAYKREHYQANRARYIANAMARNRREIETRTKALFQYFAEHPCADCGEEDPVVLEFDHLGEMGEKLFDISAGLRARSWETVLDEIEKCEVVCANCHRRRTARRSGSIRHLLANEPGSTALGASG